MGLFDGGDGFDMDTLMKMLNPMGSAEAGQPAVPGASDTGDYGQPALAKGDRMPLPSPPPPPMSPEGQAYVDKLGNTNATNRAMQPGVQPPPVIPSPVPLPRPNPLQPTPEQMQGAVRLDPSAEPPVPSVPPGGVGGALLGRGTSPEGLPPESTAPAATPPIMAKGGDDLVKKATLAGLLRGVAAPPAPAIQKISSPNAPHMSPIKSGDLQALLMALNAGAPSMDRRLPMTLGGR